MILTLIANVLKKNASYVFLCHQIRKEKQDREPLISQSLNSFRIHMLSTYTVDSYSLSLFHQVENLKNIQHECAVSVPQWVERCFLASVQKYLRVVLYHEWQTEEAVLPGFLIAHRTNECRKLGADSHEYKQHLPQKIKTRVCRDGSAGEKHLMCHHGKQNLNTQNSHKKPGVATSTLNLSVRVSCALGWQNNKNLLTILAANQKAHSTLRHCLKGPRYKAIDGDTP